MCSQIYLSERSLSYQSSQRIVPNCSKVLRRELSGEQTKSELWGMIEFDGAERNILQQLMIRIDELKGEVFRVSARQRNAILEWPEPRQ